MTQQIIARHTAAVPGRVPIGRPIATPSQIYEYTADQLQERPWTQQMLHMPAGWSVRELLHNDKPYRAGSMTGAQWASMSDEYQSAYTAALGESFGKRHDLKKPWVYGGLQWFTPYSIQGDERPPGTRFDQEPWADPKNMIHQAGLSNQTITPWALRGVGGWVFDLGSKAPALVAEWRTLIQGDFGDTDFVIGMEALPTHKTGTDWAWAIKHGIHYHALAQFRNGDPFEATVPDGATAFVWLRSNRDVDVDWLKGVWDRGWSLCVDEAHDDLVQGAIDYG